MNQVSRILLDSRGLTVAEILVAVSIIMVGLVALAGVIPVPTSQIVQGNRKTTGVFLAQERLEQIKNAKWARTPVPGVDALGGAGSNGSAAVTSWPDEGYATIAGYPSYRRTVRIVDCGGAGNPCGLDATDVNARRVTVSVFFRPMTAGGGFKLDAEDGVQVTTLIAKR